MTAQPRLPKTLVEFIRAALTTNALPGETAGLDREQLREAAEFIASAAAVRPARTTAIKIESTGGEAGRRRMRLVAINEDMPFLVDSVAGATAARDLAVHRLLHPIVKVTRDKQGRIEKIGEGQPESIIYIELDRADARGRQELVRQLKRVLSDVRAAVTDWPAMRAEMKSDADSLEKRDRESAELLRFLADNNFTLLGHAHVGRDGQLKNALGILRNEIALWEKSAAEAAVAYLGDEDRTVLILKADRISPVHRRVPLDVVMVRLPDGTLSVHTGLWTSEALRTSAQHIPVLRQRLVKLDKELGFAPSSHAGKALAHSVDIASRPSDLLRRGRGPGGGADRNEPGGPAKAQAAPPSRSVATPPLRLRLAASRRAEHRPPKGDRDDAGAGNRSAGQQLVGRAWRG